MNMSKIVRIILNGVRGVCMADGLRSVYHTDPPLAIPTVLDSRMAAEADRKALESDWSRIGQDFSRFFQSVV